MEYRQLGRSGMRVSKLCLGTMVGFNRQNMQAAEQTIHEAIDMGVNFIDTADCYGESEEVVGQALAEGGRRQKVVLATKAGWYMGKGPNDFGNSRAHLLDACEASLRRLRTDYIDLYFIHVVDPNTPMDETVAVLDLLVRQGKVRYTGTSKHPVALIMEGLAISERRGWERFVCEQTVYHLLDRRAENDLVWMAQRQGIGLTVFSPLASGLLSGRYLPGQAAPQGGRLSRHKVDQSVIVTSEALQAVERLLPLAQEKGVSLAEFSLAWLMHQPAVTAPVVGARTVEYLRSAVKACQVTFTGEELARIDQIIAPGSHVSDFYGHNVYAPLRTNYRKGTNAGAFLPDNRFPGGRISERGCAAS